MDSCGTLWKGVPKSSLEAAQASLQKDLSCQIVYFPNNSRLEQTFWENNYGKETVPKARASGFGILITPLASYRYPFMFLPRTLESPSRNTCFRNDLNNV